MAESMAALAVATVMSLILICGSSVGGAAASELLLYPDEASAQASQVRLTGNSYGVQFCTTAPIEQAEIYIASAEVQGIPEMRVSLYQWNQNYATTIAGTPVITEVISGFTKESWVAVSCRSENGPLPKGEYLMMVEDGKNGVQLEVVAPGINHTRTYMNASARGGSLRARLKLAEEGALSPISDNQNVYVASPDQWAVTDGLNRKIEVSYTDTKRENKYVGIFFHTWHSPRMHVNNGFMDINKILNKYPDIEINNYEDPRWGNAATYFWNEPIWGYYRTSDEWVLRRQAELLADAQIDVVFFDCTNAQETFLDDALTLMKVWSEARADGVKTPDVAFQLPMFSFDDAAVQLRTLYENLYEPGLYEDLWFYWKGKPLILAYPEALGVGRYPDKQIREFFQFRVVSHTQSQDGVQVKNHDGTPVILGDNTLFTDNGYQLWSWISAYPQIVNYNPDGTPEQMAVSVSHNWCKETHLTAFSNQTDTVFSRDYIPTEDRYDDRENAKLYGAYFEAQWERALEVDPEFIFITGWNEWTAGRYEDFWGVENAFIDNFSDARSRDIEPSNGDLKDHYYYQMVSYIRRFKGTEATPVQKNMNTIDLDAAEDQWDTVELTFSSYAGDTFDRNRNGYKDAETGKYIRYTDSTGRNDIVSAKVAYDQEYVTFMVETAEELTPYTDPAWMRLLIEVVYSDGVAVSKENWESFQYIVNRNTPQSETVTTLEASAGGWNWETVGEVQYRASGNRLQIQIPRTMLGVETGDFTINFKWSDNMQTDGDIMDFYVHGDVAPGGRYKYQFTAGNPVIPADENSFGKSVWPWIACGGAAAVGCAVGAAVLKKRKKVKKEYSK